MGGGGGGVKTDTLFSRRNDLIMVEVKSGLDVGSFSQLPS